jgi:hypothetical protein
MSDDKGSASDAVIINKLWVVAIDFPTLQLSITFVDGHGKLFPTFFFKPDMLFCVGFALA